MATDGSGPAPCSPELYKNGVHIATSTTFGTNHFEDLIKRLEKLLAKI